MNVIIKPAGLLVVLGLTTILVTTGVVQIQRSRAQQLPTIDTPIAGFQSKKRSKDGAVSIFDGKDAMETINLSEGGKLDWVHWGLSGPHSIDRKRDAANGISISDYTLANGNTGLLNGEEHGPSRGFLWSGGRPTSAQSVTYTGVHLKLKNGFQFSVHTDARPHTLRVYVGGYRAGGEFSAWLPDATTPVRIAMKETALQSGYYSRIYTVNFHPDPKNKDLKVVWRTGGTANGGNVSLQAATLE